MRGILTPKISVCIPSYNYAHYIGHCIKSVLAQTFEDWELIIVDNCSSDDTERVVTAFADPRIRFYTNDHNLGLVRNWNRCVSLARGGFVAVLPADDLYLPRMLDRSVAMLDAHPEVGFTHASFHRIDEHGEITETKRWWESDQVMPGLVALRRLVMGCYLTPASVVMRRECYRQVGGFDENYRFEIDWAMWMRMALSYEVAYIAEPLVCERHEHPGSVTVRRVFRQPRLLASEDFRLLGEIFGRLPETREWRELRRQAYQNLMMRHIHRTLRLLHNGESARFRSELAYAVRLDHRFPFRHRKLMILGLASLLGSGFANRIDSLEETFWKIVRGESVRRGETTSPSKT